MNHPIALAALALTVITVIYMPGVLSLLFIGVVFGVFLSDASRNMARWLRIPRKAALTVVVVAMVFLVGGFWP
ncbi:MAG: hypothetical protein ABEJ96_05375 [Thiohalorhabdaceae bacterium]